MAWGTGRVPVGVNANDTNFATVEKTGGASTVTLTTAQMPSHISIKFYIIRKQMRSYCRQRLTALILKQSLSA